MILTLSPWGVLTPPGIICAAAGVYSAFKKPEIAWAFGFVPAGGSFWAQAVFGICPTCVAAASLFVLAGMAAAIFLGRWDSLPVTTAALGGALFLMSGLIAFQFSLPERKDLVVAVETNRPVVEAQARAAADDGKMRLYFSPLCSHCEEVVRELAALDPEGKTWVPVVCPASAVYGGKKILARAGYRGEHELGEDSPTHSYPCLVVDGKTYEGEKAIKEVLTKLRC